MQRWKITGKCNFLLKGQHVYNVHMKADNDFHNYANIAEKEKPLKVVLTLLKGSRRYA